MTTIAEMFGHVAPLGDTQAYGIEVELERVFNGSVAAARHGWNIVGDGSLRTAGIEFVSPPVDRNTSIAMCTELWAIKEQQEWAATSRCGVHVHADMCNRTLSEVGAVIALYLAVEPVLFEFAGEGRAECIYCIPLYSAPDEFTTIIRTGLSTQRLRGPSDVRHTNKYAALYAEPLRRFGTLEFRAAETFDDLTDMLVWLRLIDNIVRCTYNTAEEVVEAFDVDPSAAGRAVFGDLWREDYVALMDSEDSIGVAAMLLDQANAELDWERTLEPVEITDAMRNFWRNRPLGHLQDEPPEPAYTADDLEEFYEDEDEEY